MQFYGVIVTFNRKKLLMENLDILFKQNDKLDRIIIIDNHSTDGTKNAILERYSSMIKYIDYVYMEENTGGAGGFYEGVLRAYDSGADFVYLMDDDGKPYDENTISKIKKAAKKLYKQNKLLFINSLVTTNGKDLSFGFWPSISKDKQIDIINSKAIENIFVGKANPFNGTLISKELIKKIGYPRKEFFLSRDETDYQRRSENVGALIATVVDSVYCHPASKLKYKKIFNIYVQIYPDLLKEYYYLRNAFYTYKEIGKNKIKWLCIMRALTIILYEDQKIKRLMQIKEALNDSLSNNMGKKK